MTLGIVLVELKMFLICHMATYGYVFTGLYDMGKSPSR